MDVARKVRLMHKRSKFLAGQFFVDFLDLGRKAIIRARPALAYEARDLQMGFQRGPDRVPREKSESTGPSPFNNVTELGASS